MIKFCDFLDQQKEYKLADTIIGNLNKTAMKKNHHTEDVSFDKILDLTIKYSQANPKSFMRLAAGPELNFIEIFEFLNKLGFKYEDYLKDISWSEVQRKYEAYKTATKSDPGNLTLQKLYASAKSNGAELLIDKEIVVKMRTMASTFRTQVDDVRSRPRPNPASVGPEEVAVKKVMEEAAKKTLFQNFLSALQKMFPKFSQQISKVSRMIPGLSGTVIGALFLIPSTDYWFKRISQEGNEAIDSKNEKAEFGSFLAAVAGTVSATISALTGAQTGGVTAFFGGAFATVCFVISGALGVYGYFSPREEDDPNDNLPSSKKPATSPKKPATSPTKPVTPSAKPSSPKPSKVDKKTEEDFRSLRFK